MLQFNLLPEEAKQELRWKLLARDFSVMSVFAFFWLVIVAALLIVAAQYLSIQNGALKERVANEGKKVEIQEAQQLESQIALLNAHVLTIKNIQQSKKHDTAEILEAIAPLVPAGSNLTQLSVSTDTGTVTLRGHADLRSQVVTLQTSLESNELFSDVEFPLSNISKPEDITFTFNLTLAD
jgi:Tfp pilus assembly protein PilN